jgi:NADH:ubiquinone oxidoreductase subunit E
MIKGGQEIFKYISDKLGIKNKETTPDGVFTIEEVECLGSCATAPMMQINNKEFFENLTKEKVDKFIEEMQKKHSNKKGTADKNKI